MDEGNFEYRLRTQFSFVAPDRTLSAVLRCIAERGINIVGFFQTKPLKAAGKPGQCTEPARSLVRLVAGTVESETERDLEGTRDALESLCVGYQEKSVIQVAAITPGEPGVVNAIFGALWCRVIVHALYVGEETNLFVDVSDIGEAVGILEQVSG